MNSMKTIHRWGGLAAVFALLAIVALLLSPSSVWAATVTASGTVNWSALTGGSGAGASQTPVTR